MTGLRLVRTLGIATAAALLIASCSSVDDDSDETAGDDASGSLTDGGTLTIALAAEPDLLDPTLARSLYSRYIFHAMCEKLYDLDADVNIVPQLASDLPAVSDDGLTVTIPVREGVMFADGTDFNAAAVMTSLDRHLTLEGSGRVGEMGPITSVEAPDATTVVIHLERPFAPLTAALSDRAGMVMSPAAIEESGEDFGNAPVCVGPFKFASRVPQNSIELERDPNYYDADRVHLDRIRYQILTDGNIRAANLRSGDADVADSITTQDVGGLRTTDGVNVLESDSLGYQAVTFNLANTDGVGQPPVPLDTPLASDPRIRQAFEHAIDREQLSETVFNGEFAPACSAIAPQSEFSSSAAQTCREHNPDRAIELLGEAGVEIPVPITMTVSATPDAQRIAQAIQAMAEEGGFAIEIEPIEFSALLDQQDRGDFEMVAIGWSGRVDPDANLTNFVGTQAPLNVAGYSDPDVDQLLTDARTEQDVDVRRDLYGDAVQRIQEANPVVYLYRQRNFTGVSELVGGVEVFSDGIIRVAFAGFVQ